VSEFSAAIALAGKERKMMKASEFWDDQKAFIFNQDADRVPVADI
jgi:hypothetical protein